MYTDFKPIISILFVLFCFGLEGQSEFLNLDYGVEGSTTIESWGYPYFFYNFNIDSQNRAYFGGHAFYSNSEIDSVRSRYLFTRLDEDGSYNNWGIDSELDSLFYQGTTNGTIYWMNKDKILSSVYSINTNDSILQTSRYDLDLNLECHYQSDPNVEPYSLFWHYYFYSSNLPKLDLSDRLITLNQGVFTRNNEDGGLDETYGNQGSTNSIVNKPGYQSLSSDIFSEFVLTEENETIYKSNAYTDSTLTINISYIGKLNSEGELDKNFGDEGF